MTYFLELNIKKIHGSDFWDVECTIPPIIMRREGVNILGLQAIRSELQAAIDEINKHLLNAQLSEILVECEHENDGYAYALGKCTGIKLPSLPRTPYNFKCKHCGEFYR